MSGPGPTRPDALARRLTLPDAVLIGLGSMVGAGVFSAFAPAAAAAHGWLLLSLALAGSVAFCNATSSAQLAAQYPTSGGAYVYGRERLGPWAGYAAGWCFVIGKTASAAAMALTFATYAAPGPWTKPVAVLAVVALTTVNLLGVTRTALVTRVLVTVSLVALAAVVVVGLTHTAPTTALPVPPAAPLGVLQGAGFLFFAFAGYARIATMGEEVVDPARTIPRAVTLALGAALVVYAVVAVSTLHALGPVGTAATPAPLAAVAALPGGPWPVVVRVGAAAASLGALLAIVAGIGRTSLAMARGGDLPGWLSAVHPRWRVPHRAEVLLGVVVAVLVLVTDLRGAIGFSAFGVLLYYAVANVAAWTQDRAQRRYPRVLAAVGVLGCVVLVVTLPTVSLGAGAVVLLLGFVLRAVRVRVRPRTPR